jgi:hypothetical protein
MVQFGFEVFFDFALEEEIPSARLRTVPLWTNLCIRFFVVKMSVSLLS